MKTILKSICLALVLSVFVLPAAAEEATISVSGSATVYLEADMAELNIGVRIKSKDLSAGQSECAEKIASVRKTLDEAGIEEKDIATAEFSIYSYTDFSASGAEKQYYQINHMLNITVRDISSVGKLIDLAVTAGANAVNSISFTSSEAKSAYELAMKNAVADGKEKAEILCEAAGAALGSIRNITFSSNEFGSISNSRSFKMADGAAAAEEAATEIQSGSVAVSASVTLVFSIAAP